jgi:recombination protein RecA
VPSTTKVLTQKDKIEALDAVEKVLNKQFDTTNSIIRLGKKSFGILPSYPTGITSVDYGAIGTGGVPKGRIIEIFGPEMSGKTTITLQIIAETQKLGGLCAFVDAEHALDPLYAKHLGVDTDNLYVSQPDNGEQALETVIALILSGAVDVIVVDSVAALVPQAELDGEMGDSHMGLQARLMSQAMRKITGIAAKSGTTVIFINQLREKIGVMFGNPETTTGGKALKFYASVRIDVRKLGGTADQTQIKSGGVLIGVRTKIKIVKNKGAAPFRSTVVDLIYGKGIDKEADLITYAVEVGAIEKAGSWYSFNGTKLGQGIDTAIDLIRDDPKLMTAVRAEVAKAVAAQREADEQ